MQYLVTIKKDKNPEHDPSNKKSGRCMMGTQCTDITGRHHTFLVEAPNEDAIYKHLEGVHITRIEYMLTNVIFA